MKSLPFSLVLCSCPDPRTAAGLAETLIESGLAACVSRIDGMTSTYRWEGAVQTSAESLLLIKTVDGALKELEKRITELHPYELPEIISVPISSGSADYLSWLGDQVTVTS